MDKKRGFILIFSFLLGILFINLVSAQFYSNFGRFSITDFLDSIRQEDLALMALFIISFAFLFHILGKFFRDPSGEPKRGIVRPIAFGLSLIIVYFGFYKTGFGLTNFFYGFGIDEGFLYKLLTIIILLGLIFIVWKYKISLGALMTSIGLFLLLLVIFTDIFYEELFIAVVGLILFLLGLFLLRRKKGYTSPPPDDGGGVAPPAKTIYLKRRRSIYDLQRQYDSYKFNIFKRGLTPHQRYHMLRAMYIIERYLKSMGASVMGQTPKDIEKTLRRMGLI